MVLALIIVLVVVAAGIYAGSITGFITLGPQQGGSDAAQGSPDGLIVGKPVPKDSGQAGTSSFSQTPQANGSSTTNQTNKTNQTAGNRTITTPSMGGGRSSGSGGGGPSPPSCSDECLVGQKRCKDSNYAETCDNYDSDSCLEWGTGVHCEYSCSDGECAAEDSSGNWTNISISPQIINASIGGNFTIDINIATMKSIYALDMEIGFDSTILNATNLTEGGFLKQGGASTSCVVLSFDNSIGKISYACTRLILDTGVNGTGTLLTTNFMALAAGTSSLLLEKTTIANAELGSIANIHATNGTVNVVLA